VSHVCCKANQIYSPILGS